MACYIEAAAACDWGVVDTSPVKVDLTAVRESHARRAFRRRDDPHESCRPRPPVSAIRTPNSPPARPPSATPPHQNGVADPPPPPSPNLPQQQHEAECCGHLRRAEQQLQQLRQVLLDVLASTAVALLPFELLERCKGAVGDFGSRPASAEVDVRKQSDGSLFAKSPADPGLGQDSPSRKKVAFRDREAENAAADVSSPELASPASPGGPRLVSPGHTRKRTATVVRCGNRRFTVTNPPDAAESDGPPSPRSADAVNRWKAMQTRLAEVKVQTMLQTFTPKDGAPVHRVVLTGGPCAGKSTGTALLRATLEQNGVNVFCVPEAATLLIGGGCGVVFKDCDDEKLFRFQLALLETQLAMEDAFLTIAKATKKKGVILCDRGAMDGRAFCSEEIWDRILQEGDWTTQELRDGRYDMVVHLVTAADGAEQFYGTENNAARTETPEAAVKQDRHLQKMWTGHPKVRIIDNSTDFNQKMERTVQPILELCDIKSRPGPYKKYSLNKAVEPSDVPVHTEQSEVLIQYLRGSKAENQMRLYQRTDSNVNVTRRLHSTYTYQNFRRQQGQMFRCESTLTQQQYNAMLDQVDPSCSKVRRSNLSFVYSNQYFELGTYREPLSRKGETYLWVETQLDQTGEQIEVQLPPFLLELNIEDVTDEGEDTDLALAKGGLGSLVNVAMKRKRMLSTSQRNFKVAPEAHAG